MVTSVCSPSILEAEARGFWLLGQTGQCSKNPVSGNYEQDTNQPARQKTNFKVLNNNF